MMNILRRGQRALLALLLGFGINLPAQAAYSDIYFFGDSLSDTGNMYTITGGLVPAPPYFNGGYSDGPIWVDYLASGLGLSGAASPSLKGGNNYAFGGALSGIDSESGLPVGLRMQVSAYAVTHRFAADPDALYVIAIGSNDIIGIAEALPGIDDAAARFELAQGVIDNLLYSVNYLIDRGAHNFLIANVPDIGITPGAVSGGFATAATDVSMQYNALLVSALDSLSDRANIISFDLFALLNAVVDDANAGGVIYGLDNSTIPCIGLGICDRSVFFDDIHPTATVHALAGQIALSSVVPEPSSISLLLGGLMVVGLVRRRSALKAGT